jgi:hypothetical protein
LALHACSLRGHGVVDGGVAVAIYVPLPAERFKPVTAVLHAVIGPAGAAKRRSTAEKTVVEWS